jgi:hypothetical protein
MRQSSWRVPATCAVALVTAAGARQQYTSAQDQRHATALFASPAESTPSSAPPMPVEEQAWWRKTATDLGVIAIVTTGAD